MLKRHNNNVGKRIGGYVYFHRQYAKDFNVVGVIADIAKRNVFITDEYNLVKLALNGVSITLLRVPDWDKVDEPKLTASFRYNFIDKEGDFKVYGSNPPVYHHKWLFVKDNYEGFDVEASKRRSAWIESLPVRKNNIGYQWQWDKILAKFGKSE